MNNIVYINPLLHTVQDKMNNIVDINRISCPSCQRIRRKRSVVRVFEDLSTEEPFHQLDVLHFQKVHCWNKRIPLAGSKRTKEAFDAVDTITSCWIRIKRFRGKMNPWSIDSSSAFTTKSTKRQHPRSPLRIRIYLACIGRRRM